MGGMIALRAVLRHPGFFTGLVLNGPLIVPGPQVTGCLDLTAHRCLKNISTAMAMDRDETYKSHTY